MPRLWQNAPVHLPLMLLSGLLCLAMPAVAAAIIHRRTGARLSLWGWGALAFVLSQVVHIPLNLGVAQLFSKGLLPSPSPGVKVWLLPLALGLSAGLCEEPARWLFLRWRRLSDVRTWDRGVMLGLGHGGIEAVIVGLSILSSAVSLHLLRTQGMAALGVPEELTGAVQAQLDQVFGAPPLMMLVGAAERLMAMTCHVAMSLLVMRAVRERRPRWLAASIALHTALNAGAVWWVQAGHPMGAEAFLLVMAVLSLGLILALRDPPSAPGQPTPAVQPITLQRVPLTGTREAG